MIGIECPTCTHKKAGLSCAAFDVIPEAILTGRKSHRKSFIGDRGITYEDARIQITRNQYEEKGDKPGHPFRGNQWGPGRGGAESGSSDDYGMTTALDVLTGKQPPNAASTVRRIDQTSVKSDKALGKGGVNTTRIVEIEEADGTTGKYVFKPDDGENPGVHPAFRGHQSSNEVAASIVDEALGLDMVAKTEMAEIDGKKGSLQKWVNDNAKVADALIEWKDDMVKDSSKADNAEGVADMMYFDALIGNHDRHINNWLVKDGKVKLIDNGMSMADNMEYGDISFRTLEHAGRARAMTRMTPKFKDALGKLIANKEQTDAKLREAGIGATQRQSFWKRAEYLRKAGMIGFGDSTLRDLGRLAEGRDLFRSFSPEVKGDLPGHPFRGNQWSGGMMAPDRDIGSGVASGQPLPTKDRPSEKQTENLPDVPYPKLSERHPIYGNLKSMSPENRDAVVRTIERLADEYELPSLGIKIGESIGGGLLGSASKGMKVPVSKDKAMELKGQGENVIGMTKAGTSGRGPDDRVWYHNHMGGSEINLTVGDSKGKRAFGATNKKFEEIYGSSSGFHPKTGRMPAEDVVAHEFAHVLTRRYMTSKESSVPAPAEIAKKVSGYARENLGECIAEAFVMYDAGNREPWLVDFLESSIHLSEQRKQK